MASDTAPTITVTGMVNACGTLTWQFAIAKADPAVNFPTDLHAPYIWHERQNTLALFTPESGYAWDTPNAPLAAGIHEYPMTYTPADTDNFNSITQQVTVVGDPEEVHDFIWSNWTDNTDGTRTKTALCICDATLSVTEKIPVQSPVQNGQKPTSPPTGDTANYALLAALLFVAMSGIYTARKTR